MQSRGSIHSGSFWSLAKAAAFWFLFAQAASIVAPTIDTSPRFFAYAAIVGLGVQALGLFLRSVLEYGFSWRIAVMAAICLGVGVGIFSSLQSLDSDRAVALNWITEQFQTAKNNRGILDRLPPLGSVPPGDQLAPTTRLIFGQETKEKLADARRYLLSIPESSGAYDSAQALLHFVEHRLDEIELNSVDAQAKRPIQITSIEQTGQGLRVTVRNNTSQSIQSIRYRVSYFKVADGQRIEPDKDSLLLVELPPAITLTFELNDERLNRDVYGAFQLISSGAEPADQ